MKLVDKAFKCLFYLHKDKYDEMLKRLFVFTTIDVLEVAIS